MIVLMVIINKLRFGEIILLGSADILSDSWQTVFPTDWIGPAASEASHDSHQQRSEWHVTDQDDLVLIIVKDIYLYIWK